MSSEVCLQGELLGLLLLVLHPKRRAVRVPCSPRDTVLCGSWDWQNKLQIMVITGYMEVLN